jgi:prepilin-type N-terminal cleavage/methylation domain-containing protein
LCSTPDIRRRLAAVDGFTLIELLAAILILSVGILATFNVYDSSKHATSVSESQQAEIQRAQREIERLQSLPYEKLGLTAAAESSATANNPGYYVKGGPCPAIPTFQWNQSVPLGTSSGTSQLVVNGCTYEYEPTPKVIEHKEYTQGSVIPKSTWSDGRLSGTVYDYVTWVKDAYCNEGTGCPTVNDYKRITVEVTNNTSSAATAVTKPVLVSAVVANPNALPIAGKPNTGDPLTEVKCTNGQGQTVTCNYGLGNQTPNTWYLADSPEEGSYVVPKEDNTCMHYTEALKPSLCGGAAATCTSSSTTECPQPDLLYTEPPKAEKEYNFSPNIEAEPGVLWKGEGRLLVPDPNAESCANPPSQDATKGELWATKPLEKALKLSGNGGMTIYTRTLAPVLKSVTVCLALYLENPVTGKPEGFLDPLNKLGAKDSEPLGGVISYTTSQWPTELTPVSFAFTYLSAPQEIPAKTSLAARLWVTKGAGEDIAIQYDSLLTQSSVQINSQ